MADTPIFIIGSRTAADTHHAAELLVVATEKFEQAIAVRNAQIGFLDHRRSDRRTVQKQGPVALFDPETDVGKLAVDFVGAPPAARHLPRRGAPGFRVHTQMRRQLYALAVQRDTRHNRHPAVLERRIPLEVEKYSERASHPFSA